MNEDRSHSQHIPNPMAQLEKDPVCGMKVNPATSKHVYEQEGNKYYFCCGGCVEKFKADPERRILYVCPMCPGVRESKPGPCPSCGMALEAETPLTDHRTEYTCPMH